METHLGWIARNARMSLAIDLNKIGLYFGQKGIDHFRGQGLARVVNVLAGMKIEMDTKKAIYPLQFFFGFLELRKRGIIDKSKKEENDC
jgi:hypothetical protein